MKITIENSKDLQKAKNAVSAINAAYKKMFDKNNRTIVEQRVTLTKLVEQLTVQIEDYEEANTTEN